LNRFTGRWRGGKFNVPRIAEDKCAGRWEKHTTTRRRRYRKSLKDKCRLSYHESWGTQKPTSTNRSHCHPSNTLEWVSEASLRMSNSARSWILPRHACRSSAPNGWKESHHSRDRTRRVKKETTPPVVLSSNVKIEHRILETRHNIPVNPSDVRGAGPTLWFKRAKISIVPRAWSLRRGAPPSRLRPVRVLLNTKTPLP